MKILNLINQLDINDETLETLKIKGSSRRDSFSKLADISKVFAFAAMPAMLLSVLPKKTFARTNDVAGVLNFALTLEYLEAEFYTMGITSNVIASGDTAIFAQIRKHEDAHVAFLISALNSIGATPVAKPTFDFTAGGAFDPFNVYAQFLALSQAFEDTGVRAYKGQAGNLMGAPDVLTAALQIHSVEARHASEVRRLRSDKGWIEGNSRGTLPSATQAIYDGEQNVVQGGVDVTTIGSTASAASIMEAFDEPLTDTEVNAIAGLFIA